MKLKIKPQAKATKAQYKAIKDTNGTIVEYEFNTPEGKIKVAAESLLAKELLKKYGQPTNKSGS